jgi:hypothetical protein
MTNPNYTATRLIGYSLIFVYPAFLISWIGLALLANSITFGFTLLCVGFAVLVLGSWWGRFVISDLIAQSYSVGAPLNLTGAVSVVIGGLKGDALGQFMSITGLGMMAMAFFLIVPSAHKRGGVSHMSIALVGMVPLYLVVFLPNTFMPNEYVGYGAIVVILLAAILLGVASIAKYKTDLYIAREAQNSRIQAHEAEMKRIKKSMTPAQWELYKVQLENQRLLEQIKNKPSGAIGPRPTYGITNDIFD